MNHQLTTTQRRDHALTSTGAPTPKRTGISTDRRYEFVNQCTLLEVSGMDHFLPIIRRLGIESMQDLRAQDARALHNKVVDAVGLAGAPSFSDGPYSISHATPPDTAQTPRPTPPRPPAERAPPPTTPL